MNLWRWWTWCYGCKFWIRFSLCLFCNCCFRYQIIASWIWNWQKIYENDSLYVLLLALKTPVHIEIPSFSAIPWVFAVIPCTHPLCATVSPCHPCTPLSPTVGHCISLCMPLSSPLQSLTVCLVLKFFLMFSVF